MSGAETWYVAYTGVKCEAVAAGRLNRQGFSTFCPMTSRWAHLRHKRIERRRPLFPRYLFVGVGEGLSLFALTETDGVQSLIGSGGAPFAIDRKIVADLQAAEISGQFEERKSRPIVVGETVKCMRGPFEGLLARCVALKGAERAHILIELLKREVKVEISLDEIAHVV